MLAFSLPFFLLAFFGFFLGALLHSPQLFARALTSSTAPFSTRFTFPLLLIDVIRPFHLASFVFCLVLASTFVGPVSAEKAFEATKGSVYPILHVVLVIVEVIVIVIWPWKGRSAIYKVVPESLAVDVAHDVQGVVSALPPVIGAKGYTLVVEPDPRTADELGMHEDEPAIHVVLRGSGLACDVGVDSKGRTDSLAGAVVDDTPHHVGQGERGSSAKRLLGRFFEGGQDVAVGVVNSGDDDGLVIRSAVGDGAVGRHHFEQRDGARTQRKRRHLLELTGADTHPPGVIGNR